MVASVVPENDSDSCLLLDFMLDQVVFCSQEARHCYA